MVIAFSQCKLSRHNNIVALKCDSIYQLKFHINFIGGFHKKSCCQLSVYNNFKTCDQQAAKCSKCDCNSNRKLKKKNYGYIRSIIRLGK